MNAPPPRIGPRKLRRRQPPTGLDILLALLGSVAMLLGTTELSAVLKDSLREYFEGNALGRQLFLVGMLGLHYLGLLAVIHIVVFRRRALTWRDLGLCAAAPRWYRRTLWVTLLTFALALVLTILVQRLAGRPLDNPQDAILAADGLSPGSLLGLLLVAAGLGPLVEELLFRGLLYGWMRRHFGVLSSASLSALLFASVHAIPWLIPSFFAIGMVLALLYERSGSLWPPIALHGTYNAINLILLALTIR